MLGNYLSLQIEAESSLLWSGLPRRAWWQGCSHRVHYQPTESETWYLIKNPDAETGSVTGGGRIDSHSQGVENTSHLVPDTCWTSPFTVPRPRDQRTRSRGLLCKSKNPKTVNKLPKQNTGEGFAQLSQNT